jgi:uncharacterized sulfatase
MRNPSRVYFGKAAMNRRTFLRDAGGAALATAAFGANNERPNILFAIADDMSWAHMSCAGDPVIKTPAMDRVAREGIRFTHAYCCSPSCTPSRAALLTGQHIWRLKESGNLWSTLRKAEFPVFPDILETAGYHIGSFRKGWGPGNFEAGGFTRNPAGPPAKGFGEFLTSVPEGKPFCFWLGTSDPHRPYEPGTGRAAGMKPEDVRVPPFFPDSPEVRNDILDYYFEVQRWDRDIGDALQLLEKAGKLENTLVVITSDNGMPFPRCKTNLYDYGSRMPFLVMWRKRVKGGRVVDDFVSHTDVAPTVLEAAALKPLPAMTGRSLMPVLTASGSGRVDKSRDHVVYGRERHTNRRAGQVGYPKRAIRTHDWLYIRNYKPERGPSGDEPDYGDIDASPTKSYILDHRNDPKVKPLFELSCGKRPEEELYDIHKDPFQMKNLAGEAAHAKMLASMRERLRERLRKRLVETADPRETGGEIIWDTTPYYGAKG